VGGGWLAPGREFGLRLIAAAQIGVPANGGRPYPERNDSRFPPKQRPTYARSPQPQALRY
jgi:hypothetical protein